MLLPNYINWIMPDCTSQSLPPLRPCLTSHFRQGWGCECTFRLAPPDFGFDNFRIKSTNPVSQAVVYFAISFITSSTRAAIPQTSFPTPNANVNLLAKLRCPTSPSLFLRLVVLLR